MIKRLFALAVIVALSIQVRAGEGMWLPQLLKMLNESEMQAMGMKLTAEDIYSINKGSLKDAIVHFGGFCTSELISPKGLLLTNHHCGYGAIQSHTSLENNYLEEGFWAANMEEEKPNDGLTATFIVRIEDVSKEILKGVERTMPKSEQDAIIRKNMEEVKIASAKESYQDLFIRPFFKGNQYFMFITQTYRDVRLVGAPPSSIGKFGADTDNWVWPRHTGDFSLFRIYADKNNLPADYSPDNKPYAPKHYLPISLDGVETGDFTLVFGFPGRTNEYLHSAAIQLQIETINPARIGIRDKALKIVDAAMRSDEEVKIQYASKFASIANYWKKWIGESQGLQKTNAIGKKQKFEKEFQKRLASNESLYETYGDILSMQEKQYEALGKTAKVAAYQSEILGRNIEVMRVFGLISRLTGVYENNGEAGYQNFKGRLNNFFKGFYKNYRADVDQNVFAALMQMYLEDLPSKYIPLSVIEKVDAYDGNYDKWAAYLYANSNLTDQEKLNGVLDLEPDEAVAKLKSDPIFEVGAAIQNHYNEQVAGGRAEVEAEISRLLKDYMYLQMELFPERSFYPDANSTMRVTYGKVNGYQPRDAVSYEPVTYLDGVMEKYKPGDYEFDVSKKLRDLYEAKDYGQYADSNGKVPVCFIGTNHTTGGNSGSPAIDAHGNLIGLNFDRAWEGTMSDLNYDPSICRNIMVDARYILFIIDKYAGAGHLIEEMKLVHPKR